MVKIKKVQQEKAEKSIMSTEKDQVHSKGTGSEDGQDSNDNLADDEVESFIRVRSQNDGIFEQEEEEEDDEFYDFTIPEVELRSPPSRKRKQDISFIDNELTDIIEVTEEDEQEYTDQETSYTLDPELFQSRKRDRLPLYLLNPDEYAHDPKKQIQIRRAIITYRHHRDKKEQIIRLTEENKMLREHTEALKAKIVELSRCGCEKNQYTSLEVLDVIIPSVPPRMYVRGNRPVLAVPFHRSSLSPTSFSKSSSEVVKNEGDSSSTRFPSNPMSAKSTVSSATKQTAFDASKPLINITSSRLANINCKTLASNNVATSALPKPPISKMFANGTVRPTQPATVQKGLQMGNANSNRVSISGITANRPGFIPISAAIKTEPGVSSVTMNNSRMSTTTNPSFPMTAILKSESTSTPATAAPVSRIVFAKKGNTTNAVQTASQLLFGRKSTFSQSSSSTGLRPACETNLQMTASQLAFASRTQKPATVTNPLSSLNNPVRVPNQNGQVFKTASGQVLKLVQPPVARNNNIPRHGLIPKWKPIAPKPTPGFNPQMDMLTEAAVRQFNNKQRVEDLWIQYDDDPDTHDDDEMAMIAAISGASPPQRNRKQAVGHLTKFEEEKIRRSTNVLKSCGEEIELNKYKDIVFEEAD